jgi:CubicO group peptidase (beta-lactamase class C family)
MSHQRSAGRTPRPGPGLWIILAVPLLLAFLCLLLASPSRAVVVPANFSRDLEAFIACLMTGSALPMANRPPELTVAVVANGALLHARGYGRDIRGRAITNRTLFGLGSVSKAFTSTLMGVWQERGAVDPLQPIHEYAAGSLRTYDGYIDTHATLRDLLTHRTGISPSGFLQLLIDPEMDWRQVVKQYIPRMPPTVPFRSDFLYNNWVVAQRRPCSK